jgi:two-component system, NtrC family, nitrogen regulation sensor histidine kinase NtrY
MSLRQKLLLLFSLTIAAAVAAVAWTVLVRIRRVFEQRDQEETALFVSQFQLEFQHRSAEVASAVGRIAASDRARTIAFEIMQSGDASPFLTDAGGMAQDAQLDFLEIIGPDGNVISSAQWPARFGYPEPAVASARQNAFLKREELPDGSSSLGLFAVQTIGGGAVRLIGGERLDQRFLADLPVAPGMEIGLYSDAGTQVGVLPVASTTTMLSAGAFDSSRLLGPAGALPDAAHYQALIAAALKTGQPASGIVDVSGRRGDSLNATVIPLRDEQGNVLAVLTVAIARRGMVEAQQHIRAIAYGVAAGGILLAIVFSLWITSRVSQPIEQLAQAAEEVAAGNWETRVPQRGRGELSVLARSFNHMTGELVSQREQLIQSERVAAWRELARRLAHELKNPLFPLQLTVENLVRARALPAEEFDEVFRESTSTLGTEIANLKSIIARFSDFSKMPKPELERVDAADVLERVRTLYERAATEAKIGFVAEVARGSMPLNADPELLHRAFSNLVLNAMDAMPDGGKLTISARPDGDKIELRVADTGKGLTPEECERLFTPYYTTKQYGTGLGLAIVQSVIADHAGTITVESRNGEGATFTITLPRLEA